MTKLFRVITTALICILAFLFIMFTGLGIGKIADGLSVYIRDEDSFLYALEDNRYSDLMEYYHENVALEAKTTKTMEECYAIARYYEAAIDYKIAVQENDIELLKKAQEVMSLAESQMGELTYAKDEIDDLLEI